jgi:hypothetical protein
VGGGNQTVENLGMPHQHPCATGMISQFSNLNFKLSGGAPCIDVPHGYQMYTWCTSMWCATAKCGHRGQPGPMIGVVHHILTCFTGSSSSMTHHLLGAPRVTHLPVVMRGVLQDQIGVRSVENG